MIFCKSFSNDVIVMDVVNTAQNPDRTIPITRNPIKRIQYMIMYMELVKSKVLEVQAPTQ